MYGGNKRHLGLIRHLLRSNHSRCSGASTDPIDYLALSPDALRDRLGEHLGSPVPNYRVKQIHKWVHERGVHDIYDMSDLPLSLREAVRDVGFTVGPGDMRVVREQRSSKDATVKRLYGLGDGNHVETVMMSGYDDGRVTACVSSQAGCAMGCVFCATGQMGIKRQLSTSEILKQVTEFDGALKRRSDGGPSRLSNIVFMGMGEPLANYRNVIEACRRITRDVGISARKITISTVGVVPNIRRLAQEVDLPVNLAVSLHCADDRERSQLIPANRRFGGLDALMAAVRDYHVQTRRRVSFEWTLIANENDSPESARALAALLRRFDLAGGRSHVNVIPMNPTAGFDARPSERAAVRRFCKTVTSESGVSATPRVRRGIDIEAGCGQLAFSQQ